MDYTKYLPQCQIHLRNSVTSSKVGNVHASETSWLWNVMLTVITSGSIIASIISRQCYSPSRHRATSFSHITLRSTPLASSASPSYPSSNGMMGRVIFSLCLTPSVGAAMASATWCWPGRRRHAVATSPAFPGRHLTPGAFPPLAPDWITARPKWPAP